ncbi:hypothetical protein MPSI1_002892 [Malassezia psittaci]|uniref:GPN-loop GTPase n=1 Tax=Malassezia psittaci TaxID=1821823 RepID=A0AAF0F6U2_9BASI|nr:hypothetical protein MPSI1_002892 [Malassezia psittaci]
MIEANEAPPRATAVIVIGMAGSGKSTFVARLAAHMAKKAAEARATKGDRTESHSQTETAKESNVDAESSTRSLPTRPYLLNIDPAVAGLGYSPNIDIRDTVDYARVMQEYKLGPNGAILTALNLFTTKFDQVLQLVEKRAKDNDLVLLDTPGQIEIFTWSASGAIITDALASALPTVVAYVVDTPRTTAPATFMSNMLYACSIMYKTKLPFVIVFNKTDVQDPSFAFEWMQDFEAFQKALMAGNARDPSILATNPDAVPRPREEEPSYLNSLMNSMSLVLDEFYKNLRAVGVSSATGQGMDAFLSTVDEARTEFIQDYFPEMCNARRKREQQLDNAKDSQMQSLLHDMRVREPRSGLSKVRTQPSSLEEEEGPQYAGDGEIIDPDSDEEKPEYGVPGGDDRLAKQWNKHDGSYWPAPP